jgi:hypothetical protein
VGRLQGRRRQREVRELRGLWCVGAHYRLQTKSPLFRLRDDSTDGGGRAKPGAGAERARVRANDVGTWYCLSAWSVVDRTTASMGWGRPSPTRCKYILVRSPPASMPPDGRRKPPPTHAYTASPFAKHPGCIRTPSPGTKGWAYRYEPGRGFSGRLEAGMPEASLQGGTCGVPLKSLPGSCTAPPPGI